MPGRITRLECRSVQKTKINGVLTRQDWKDIEGRLKQIIRSFRFLR